MDANAKVLGAIVGIALSVLLLWPTGNTKTVETLYHQYVVVVVDLDGTPLEGAQVACLFTQEDGGYSQTLKENIAVTDSTGTVTEIAQPNFTEAPLNYEIAQTELNYKITKEGYDPRIGRLSMASLWSIDKWETLPPKSEETVILLRPLDYLDPTFASSNDGQILREKILRFLSTIQLQSLLVNSRLIPRSISLQTFKGNRYLQFRLVNQAAYNSLKFSKYDLAKTLFDEVVRKVLDPLNSFISDPDAFFGYDLIIVGHLENFAQDSHSRKSIECRFMMPQSTVGQYKDKDITGQQVLNESIILMDDERVELELQ